MLIFRQLFDAQSSTYTYLLGDSVSREALLIVPAHPAPGRRPQNSRSPQRRQRPSLTVD